jgi:hypothetical protein
MLQLPAAVPEQRLSHEFEMEMHCLAARHAVLPAFHHDVASYAGRPSDQIKIRGD